MLIEMMLGCHMMALISYGNINVTLFITEGGFGGGELDSGPVRDLSRAFDTGKNVCNLRILNWVSYDCLNVIWEHKCHSIHFKRWIWGWRS